MDRRKFLLATAGTTTLAGCSGLLESESGPSVADHFGTDGVENQPVLGEDLSAADNVVVAFLDPSCNICADFHSDGYEDLRPKLIEPGEIAFVARHV